MVLADITGIKAMTHDMCPNSCLAYVGPYDDREMCPTCGEFRLHQIKLRRSNGRVKAPRAVFNTIPLGPQLQALFMNRETAQKIHYGEQRTEDISEELNQNEGLVNAYNDVLTGSAHLEAVRNGKIRPKDMLMVLSIDGAQFCESKLSDCWIYIWIILAHCPDERYKKTNVLPGRYHPWTEQT